MFFKELKRLVFNLPSMLILLSAIIASLTITSVSTRRYMRENESEQEYELEYLKTAAEILQKKKSSLWNVNSNG